MTGPITAQEVVTREVRRAIVAQELKPGDRIHQENLASKLGVSRVPVREALKGLEAEGQVTGRLNRGYYVTELTIEELEEIYRLRYLLEDTMNREAAANMGEEIIARLETLIVEMTETMQRHDVRRFEALNKAFHFAIFEQAKLPRFRRIAEQLWESSDAYRSMYLNDPEALRRIENEHALILQACKNRDAEALVEYSAQQRNATVSKLADLLNGDGKVR